MSPLRPENQIHVTPTTTTPASGPAVVVHLTDKPEGRAALRWALQYAGTYSLEGHDRDQVGDASGAGAAPTPTPLSVHVVLSGGDREASAAFFSPSVMDALEQELRDAGLPHTIHEPTDDPVGQILAITEKVDARALVTGVVRRSATMKLILGSHTQQLLLQATCPVVAVKAAEN